jgi:hypothetical protein
MSDCYPALLRTDRQIFQCTQPGNRALGIHWTLRELYDPPLGFDEAAIRVIVQHVAIVPCISQLTEWSHYRGSQPIRPPYVALSVDCRNVTAEVFSARNGRAKPRETEVMLAGYTKPFRTLDLKRALVLRTFRLLRRPIHRGIRRARGTDSSILTHFS